MTTPRRFPPLASPEEFRLPGPRKVGSSRPSTVPTPAQQPRKRPSQQTPPSTQPPVGPSRNATVLTPNKGSTATPPKNTPRPGKASPNPASKSAPTASPPIPARTPRKVPTTPAPPEKKPASPVKKAPAVPKKTTVPAKKTAAPAKKPSTDAPKAQPGRHRNPQPAPEKTSSDKDSLSPPPVVDKVPTHSEEVTRKDESKGAPQVKAEPELPRRSPALSGETSSSILASHVSEDENTEPQQEPENETMGDNTVLKPAKKEKRKVVRKIFSKVMKSWGFMILIGALVVAGWGYKSWIDASTDKLTDQAYRSGMTASRADPDVMGVLKMTSADLQKLVLDSPASRFESGTSLSDYKLDGWLLPGGTEREGKARLTFCHGFADSPNRFKGSAYLVSPDASARFPEWSVESVSSTSEPCR